MAGRIFREVNGHLDRQREDLAGCHTLFGTSSNTKGFLVGDELFLLIVLTASVVAIVHVCSSQNAGWSCVPSN